MNFETILGKVDFLEFLRGKKATFLLSCSVTKTCEIPNISQAGIPGKLYLTPTLDAEFLCTKEVRSLPDIAQTPKGVPTPALITRAIHELNPYSNIEILNLGLEVIPQINYFKIHNFDIKPSESITAGAKIEAMEIFQKGLEFGQNYQTKDEYVILAETIPAGTTTANATAKALGYECDGYFSSSFKNNPSDIKNETIKKALDTIDKNDDIFEKLSKVSDNMIIFNAGFILGSRVNELKVILAGGTQMASVLLVVNSILKSMDGEIDSSNLALCTTKWISKDENSNIKAILEQLDFPINTYASEFDFSLSNHPALKLYDEGEAKEGVGCGAALCYATINGLTKEQITNKIESFLG
ncbi:nicotinate mononucleotide-dependent phosphoribosyltransferase CobT [Arcobacter ellisii]|uniref:Nicotinate-nucleotide--dimethylbenzimidazole phosphoribosyltransferase n=1 Tax=Arcobacter ellisii TaxID=913109 RepID=A0A347UBL7_9BACT|nr:TIGR00303 family protein [Arcobacter ellisii]AXX96245.1 nicotinate-nucleotide--dimethylbenzimidazole phosphoribosyltransferase [Arcobacter ellisii]RXI31909.1 TIGR00303 family protein [Arcobacter ellisii]